MGERMRGKVSVITGGASGIGEAAARLFAAEGGSVVVVDRDAERVALVADEIEAAGGSALGLTAMVEQEAAWGPIMEATIRRFGAIHCLVGSAGMRLYGPIAEATEASWDAIWAVNVKHLAFAANAVTPHLAAAGGGSMVLVSSSNGAVGRSGMAQYDTTKAAVLGLTRSLACDLWPQRIRVNAVTPGATLTRFHHLRAEAQGITIDQWRAQMQPTSIMGRWGEPSEIAYGILFLACDESSFMTGITLPIDGGYSSI